MNDHPSCPCDSLRPYINCCGLWHAGPSRLQAPDALTLMRSRYSAFVLEQADYLRDTWHPSTRPADIGFEPGLRWLGLQIRQHRVIDEDQATVEFVARSKLGGRAQRLHEISQFLREDRHWFYLSGDLKR